MLEALEIFKHPILLKKALKLRGKAYTIIAPLKVTVATAEEPFAAEEGVFRNIRKWGYWGKAFNCAQFHVTGTVPDSYDKKDLGILADVGGEGQLYRDNQPTVALTNRIHSALDIMQAHKGKSLIKLSDVTESAQIDFFIDAGYNGSLPHFPFKNARFFGVHLVKINKDAKAFYYDYLTLLYQYLADKNSVDYQRIDKAYSLFMSGKTTEAFDIINEISKGIPVEDFTFHCVGHSHLDLAWLWPIRETKRKAVRTVCNQLNNIKDYPFYNYGISQPQQLEWISDKYPNFFEIIKQKVKENRIEIQGGMWVEPDINLASGEALIRQIYYGQRFWKEHFDKTSTICWLPDVFGYSGSLPQILKKAAIDNFMTIKLSWNEVNKFPHTTFNWSGIDGSCVLVHMPPTGDYNSDGTAICLRKAIKNNKEKDVKEALFLFGAGDGGGGPSEAQIEVLSRRANLNKPNVVFSRAEDFFSAVRAKNYALPSYSGELYLEKHQGTFTSQAKIKYYNRRMESLLQVAEVLCTHNYLANREYPSAKLDKIWKEVLLYQFHDILPGSSINRVNAECVARYQILEKEVLDIIHTAANKIGGGKGYFNISPCAVSTTKIMNNECLLIEGSAYSTCTAQSINPQNPQLEYAENVMSNGKVTLSFDRNGSFALYDITLDKDVGTYNEMVIYKDPYRWYNAWDIKQNYYKKRKKLFTVSYAATQIVGNTVVREQLLKNSSGYVKQTIYLKENSSTVEIHNTALVNGTLRMLRMDNKPSFWSDEATFDIQFGNIKRSTKEDSNIEKAQFEVCAHKYVDITAPDYGVSILNDCKYGYRVKEGNISVNLIRKPIYPDERADRREHSFKIAIMPHKEPLNDSLVVESAYQINREPMFFDCKVSPLIVCSGGIVIETIKKGIADNTVAVRCYEPLGNDVTAAFTPNFNYTDVEETNLLEQKGKQVDLESINFGKFEIKTLVFKL